MTEHNMSGPSKELDEIGAGSSGMLASSEMEGEDEYYNPDGTEWSQKAGLLCRICANPNEYLIPIFDGEGLEHELGTKIQKHLPIKVTETDTLPIHVCYQCASTLIAWHDLVNCCVEADKKLRELQMVEDDEDDDDKGAEMFESHSFDSEMVAEDDGPSTSELQNQAPEIKSPKKLTVDKKSKLKMVLVKGSAAGTSGQKIVPKIQVAKVELGKPKEGTSQDSASERCQQPPQTSFKDFQRVHNEMRNITQTRNNKSAMSDIIDAVKIESSDSEDAWFTCNYCGHISSGKGDLVIHISSMHSESVGDLVYTAENKSGIGIKFKKRNSNSRDSIEQEHKSDVNISVIDNKKNYIKLEHNFEDTDNRKEIRCKVGIGKTGDFSCDICSRIFTRKHDLLRHMKLHGKYSDLLHSSSVVHDTDFPAAIQNISDNRSDTSSHNEVGNNDNILGFPCDVCGRILTRRFDLYRHMKTHSGKTDIFQRMLDNDIPVLTSEKDLSKNDQANDNVEGNGKDTTIKNELNEEIEVGFSCSICGKVLARKFHLERHILTHSSKQLNTGQRNVMHKKRTPFDMLTDSSFLCEECPKSFTRKYDLKRHTKLHATEEINKVSPLKSRISNKILSDAKVTVDDRILYKCGHCSKHLVTRYSYIRHLRIHTGEKPCTCHVCGKQFRTSALLNRHVRDVHEGIKEHPCDICGRRFKNKRAMMDHRTIHTGERSCVCHLCGKAFKTKACLYIHNLFHQDVFPHKCSHCDKAFRRRQQLDVHLLLHTGEKPHCCETCGKCFRLRKTLKRHVLTHTTEKPYECHICGQLFAQERYLKNHGKTHGVRIANKSSSIDSALPESAM